MRFIFICLAVTTILRKHRPGHIKYKILPIKTRELSRLEAATI